MGIFQTGKNKKKCRELLDNGTKYLISAQQNILTTSRQNWKLAKETFEEIFEVDPDNKTGYHTHAWYMLGLTWLSFAWIHSRPQQRMPTKQNPGGLTRDVITKEGISKAFNLSRECITKALISCSRRIDEKYPYPDRYPGTMFSISNIFFPCEPFIEPCQTALSIARDGLTEY